ncbi:MAG: hypothetical protein EBZ48_12570 [Proteobacteria bacterium]|nr:hypothetical protein [Pseudomonadota bacterium]
MSRIAPLSIIVATVLFFISVWGLARYYLGQFSIPAEVVYGGPLPANLKQLASFQTPEGLTADLYNSNNFTKVGFAFSFDSPAAPEVLQGQALLEILRLSSRAEAPDPRLSGFTARYLSAQFDARRAYDIAPVELKVNDRVISAARFVSKAEWNHLVGMVNLPYGQFVFQAVRKNTPVDPHVVAEIVGHQLEVSKSWSRSQGS